MVVLVCEFECQYTTNFMEYLQPENRSRGSSLRDEIRGAKFPKQLIKLQGLFSATRLA
jgi:hypothetical protein